MKSKNQAAQAEFKFSFVMPVYNVEDYIGGTIESVLRQQIGFEQNVQLILVDDGSSDNSADICKSYAARYPDNIEYIYQDNTGVSAARNRGLERVRGMYVSFLDSDDTLTKDTLDEVYNFFSLHGDVIDVVAIRILFTGARKGGHYLNTKFHEGDRVIDLDIEPQHRLINSPTAFFKASVINDLDLKYDERLKYAEDAKFANDILIRTLKLGVVTSPVYYYHKRAVGGSAVDRQTKDMNYYKNVPDYYLSHVIRKSLECYGRVVPYVQLLVMNEIRWRVRVKHDGDLTTQQMREYIERLRRILKYIDDSVILNLPEFAIEQKLYVLSIKRGRDVIKDCRYREDGNLWLDDTLVYKGKRLRVHVNFVEIDSSNGIAKIEGWYGGFANDNLEVCVRVGGRDILVQQVDRPDLDVKSMGKVIYRKNGFIVNIPLDKVHTRVVFRSRIAGVVRKVSASYDRMTQLNDSVENSYKVIGGCMVELRDGRLLISTSYTLTRHIKKELRSLMCVSKKRKFDVLFYRIAYYVTRPFFMNRKIWLVSDRPQYATDNASYLFGYLNGIVNLKKQGIYPYFILDRDSKDRRKMQQYGKVVDGRSLRYKILFLHSDKIISSHFDNIKINAFGGRSRFINDLYRFSFVYIGHGIMLPDLSALVNRYGKNIKLLTAACASEASGIIDNTAYGYGNDVVVTTGYPRFDGISRRSERVLLIAPTWRLSVAGKVVDGVRYKSSVFIESEYYKFYQRLINDERLLKNVRKYGYKVELLVHPNHAANADDFQVNDKNVAVCSPPYEYEDKFNKSRIMLTDYSGVAFDFAYGKKAVVYTQFDKEYFYENHTYTQGSYDFERDGFGPVVYDYESTIQSLICAIKRDGKLDTKYEKRAKDFFFSLDQNNSKRVYEAILALDK